MSTKGPGDTGKQSRKVLTQTTNEIAGSTREARQSYFEQLNGALKTGGIGGNIPILNTALEGSRGGTADALRATETSLNRAGIGGSTGAGILSDTAITGGRATSATRNAIVQQFLSQAPSAALGQTAQATTTLQGIAARGAQNKLAGDAAASSNLAAGGAAAGAVIGAVVIAI